ncbi:hypothetical protein J4216_03645 [Candidatus Woesearchaeota archaeon]|nr:hypothetical protein [Candidatus Woesearchaeota archaeon]
MLNKKMLIVFVSILLLGLLFAFGCTQEEKVSDVQETGDPIKLNDGEGFAPKGLAPANCVNYSLRIGDSINFNGKNITLVTLSNLPGAIFSISGSVSSTIAPGASQIINGVVINVRYIDSSSGIVVVTICEDTTRQRTFVVRTIDRIRLSKIYTSSFISIIKTYTPPFAIVTGTGERDKECRGRREIALGLSSLGSRSEVIPGDEFCQRFNFNSCQKIIAENLRSYSCNTQIEYNASFYPSSPPYSWAWVRPNNARGRDTLVCCDPRESDNPPPNGQNPQIMVTS